MAEIGYRWKARSETGFGEIVGIEGQAMLSYARNA